MTRQSYLDLNHVRRTQNHKTQGQGRITHGDVLSPPHRCLPDNTALIEVRTSRPQQIAERKDELKSGQMHR